MRLLIEPKAIQVFRRTCFEQIGGYMPLIHGGEALANLGPTLGAIAGIGLVNAFNLVADVLSVLTLTGMVLLVVCLNISGMMQVRSALRERELSIRQAIGASRLRLARHLLAEAVWLAAAGGTLASLVLFNAPRVVSRLAGKPIPVPLQDALKLDTDLCRGAPGRGGYHIDRIEHSSIIS